MIRTCYLWWIAPIMSIGLLLFAGAKTAAAQEVVGISEILSSTSSSDVYTWSETDLDYFASEYYYAYVEGYLYENGTQIAAGSAIGYPAAGGGLSAAVHEPDNYEIQSDHYLYALYYYPYTDYWANPYEFLIADYGSVDSSGTGFASGGGPAYYDTVSEYFYLGSTGVEMSSAAPSITSINPAYGTVGTSGTITINGTNLIDVFTSQTTPAISGSGVTLTINSQTATTVVLNYSIATNATTGEQSLTLATRFGTSNAVSFNVGDPSPVLSSVNPSSWNAGATTPITITGQHFGTNPSLTITGNGVTGSSITGSSDTQIQANVSVAASAPSGTATVQVQSNGYNGNGFLSASGGQPAQASLNAAIVPLAPPPPQIMFNGTNVAQTTQSVYVGQEIALSVPTTNLPAGLTITSQSWTGPTASTAVGGYTASTNSGAIVQLPATNTSTFTFYWVAQGSQQISYTWSFNNGTSVSASVTFNVGGPTGVNVTTTEGSEQVLSILSDANGTQTTGPGGVPSLALYGVPFQVKSASGTVGIKFSATAQLPNGATGSYSWIQLINSDTVKVRLDEGPVTCSAFSGQAELDTVYPYGVPNQELFQSQVPNDTATDDPVVNLTGGEQAESWSATMYLMWTPPAASGCTSSACTIPVPLGYVNWSANGYAINTLASQSNNTTWTSQNCGNGGSNTFVATTVHPKWQKAWTSGSQLTCQ